MPTFDVGITGLTGTIGLTVYNEDGTVYAARSTVGVTEFGYGTYWHPDPDPSLKLVLVWDTGVGTTTASETLPIGRGIDPLPSVGSVQRKYDGPWTKMGLHGIAGYEATILALPNGTYQGWHSSGNDTRYLTAPSFYGPWTDQGLAVAAHKRSSVTLVGSTYHMYCAATGDSQIDHYTSSDGATWTQIATDVLHATAGAWDSTAQASTFLIQNGSTWYLFYEAYGPGYRFQIGVATASSPAGPWTKYGTVPVIGRALADSNGSFAVGRPCVRQVGADFYMWFHGALINSLPTDVYRAHSTDLLSWQVDANPLIVRSTYDEGAGRSGGQMADVRVYELGTQLVMTYTACTNGSAGTIDGIAANTSVGTKYAVAPLPRTVTVPMSAST